MADESQSQTQPQAKQLMTDIFGSDDEDDNNDVQQKPASTSAARFDDSDDDIFAGSDDDDKKGPANKSSAKPSLDDEDLLDSDDENAVVQLNKGQLRKKRAKAPPASKPKGKLQKRKAPSSKRDRSEDGSGNEYDSGEEVRETKDDRNFIDGDDDFADIVKEYDEDNTDFNDEAPDEDYPRSNKKAKKGSSASSGGSHLSSGINLKDQDPLSQTLAAMKNPKAVGLTDAQKDIMVEKLQIQMAKAVKLDDASYAQQQPAVAKMQLLDTVRTTISMKPLHQTLLDKDILANLRDWIEPRDANTLPALSVRTTVYELLMQLPCLPDHLKRSNGDKAPIGMVIVSLRKHKMETTANKRLLKELMDKWSRPIFSKSADVRVGSGAGALPTSEHPEVAEAIMQRYLNQSQNQRSSSQKSQGGDSSSRASGAQRNVDFGNILSGRADGAGSSSEAGADGEPKKAPDLYTRARTPYNTGFLFTVQPELKNIDKRNVMERSLGEGRMKLFKKMSEGGGNKALGRKANPRAMDMSVSSANKS